VAVVKADAYGHGAVETAQSLRESTAVAGFAVSLVEEAVELREAGITGPIWVMGPSLRGGYDAVFEKQLTPLISSLADLEELAAAARAREGAGFAVHLKLDTGMGRLGLRESELDSALATLSSSSLVVEGLATHLGCADLDDPADPDSVTAQQIRRFETMCSALSGLRARLRHAANSAGLLFFPKARQSCCRPGLALYGNGPRPEGLELKQVIRLVSSITQIRSVERGQRVSYGGRWTASAQTRVAVVPIGYADGLPRNASGKARCLVGGQSCEVIGTISMDMALVDITAVAAEVGDAVVLLGGQGQAQISVEDMAQWAGISTYEVTCGISKRVPRILLGANG
jgi:alanine racemase